MCRDGGSRTVGVADVKRRVCSLTNAIIVLWCCLFFLIFVMVVILLREYLCQLTERPLLPAFLALSQLWLFFVASHRLPKIEDHGIAPYIS